MCLCTSEITNEVMCIEQTDQAGRLPDTGLPAVENGSVVTDFAWDPFNNSRLAVGMLLSYVELWNFSHV